MNKLLSIKDAETLYRSNILATVWMKLNHMFLIAMCLWLYVYTDMSNLDVAVIYIMLLFVIVYSLNEKCLHKMEAMNILLLAIKNKSICDKQQNINDNPYELSKYALLRDIYQVWYSKNKET